MSETTEISWANSTFNPWIGCTQVSLACENCYAEAWGKRFGVKWGAGEERRRTSASYWKQPLRWNRKAELKFQAWENFKRTNPGLTDAELIAQGFVKPQRPRVFCASLADWLDNDVPVEWLVDLLDLIRRTPHLDWLLLTKRPGNFKKRIWGAFDAANVDSKVEDMVNDWIGGTYPDNVWIGATVCNQEEADRDIPKLLSTPAAKRFLSIEPMLGPISFDGMFANERDPRDGTNMLECLDWVICGGESGSNARPMHPDWPRNLRDQCATAGTPFLFKQHGEWAPAIIDTFFYPSSKGPQFPFRARGKDCHDFGGGVGAVRVGKRVAGRLLDGVIHDEHPLGDL